MGMIQGMTGFGSAQVIRKDFKAIVEIKSVNHRYLDIVFYLPPGFGAFENRIKQMIQEHVERGRITVAVKVIPKSERLVKFNKQIIREYIKQAKSLGRNTGIEGKLTLSDLVKLPGVIEEHDNSLNPDDVWIHLQPVFQKALNGFSAMRAREGQALARDVRSVLARMTSQFKIIEKTSATLTQKMKKTLTDEEFQSFQKSSDINEELTRLTHYIGEMKPLLQNGKSAGKKIDFIAQEMHRETNTIGSKVQDRVVGNAVISLKSHIEKIREQSQNIE